MLHLSFLLTLYLLLLTAILCQDRYYWLYAVLLD